MKKEEVVKEVEEKMEKMEIKQEEGVAEEEPISEPQIETKEAP